MQQNLMLYFNKLLDIYGRQYWWPGESPFEIALGALLTQNTNWNNVEVAIKNLKERNLLDAEAIISADRVVVEECIKPSGYFRQKYIYLINLCNFIINELDGDIVNLKKFDIKEVRKRLLLIKGIGEETADSIILYAVGMPVFVVDAYTKRLFNRIGLFTLKSYRDVQEYFHERLDADLYLYQEYHALIVMQCKSFCRVKPLCETCLVESYCKKNVV